MLSRKMLSVVTGSALAAAIAMPSVAGDITKTRMETALLEPQNWISVFQNYKLGVTLS